MKTKRNEINEAIATEVMGWKVLKRREDGTPAIWSCHGTDMARPASADLYQPLENESQAFEALQRIAEMDDRFEWQECLQQIGDGMDIDGLTFCESACIWALESVRKTEIKLDELLREWDRSNKIGNKD